MQYCCCEVSPGFCNSISPGDRMSFWLLWPCAPLRLCSAVLWKLHFFRLRLSPAATAVSSSDGNRFHHLFIVIQVVGLLTSSASSQCDKEFKCTGGEIFYYRPIIVYPALWPSQLMCLSLANWWSYRFISSQRSRGGVKKSKMEEKSDRVRRYISVEVFRWIRSIFAILRSLTRQRLEIRLGKMQSAHKTNHNISDWAWETQIY